MEGSCKYAIKKMGRYIGEYDASVDNRVWLISPNVISAIADDSDPYTTLFDTYSDEPVQADVLLKGLSYREALISRLYFFEGLTFKEISERLGISRSSVQIYINRGKQKMLDHFRDWIDDMFLADESPTAKKRFKYNQRHLLKCK